MVHFALRCYTAMAPYLEDHMNYKIRAMYHMLLQSQLARWTISPFENHLVLKVQSSLSHHEQLGLNRSPSTATRFGRPWPQLLRLPQDSSRSCGFQKQGPLFGSPENKHDCTWVYFGVGAPLYGDYHLCSVWFRRPENRMSFEGVRLHVN